MDNDETSWGLRSITSSRSAMNVRIDECMRAASDNYDIIAYGLRSLRSENALGVEHCLKNGVQIRIITVNPDCNELPTRDILEGRETGNTAHDIVELRNWVSSLQRAYPRQIQIRYLDFLPTEFYCRVDKNVFVGPYQYGRKSQQTLTIEYRKPGKGYAYYTEYFESMWNAVAQKT